MKNEWILDVLADLTVFAKQNGMGVLAEQLDDTQLIAACELASLEGARLHDGCSAVAAGSYPECVGKRL